MMLRLLALLFVVGSLSTATAQDKAARPPLGLNLAGVTDWSSELVFADAFQSARAWISQAKGQPWGKGPPLDIDSKGHVRSLREGQYAETVVFANFADRYPAGDYICRYQGQGDVEFWGDARVVERQPGRLKVEIRPKGGMATARIMRTDPKDPVRSIHLFHPGLEESAQAQPFLPDFLKRWEGFRVFRFMDWQRTNNSKLADWADRPTPESHSQALGGVCLEYMIRLCNLRDVEPWFCMPHRASDDFVRRFAGIVKEQLKPNLKVHIEYSNECWNGQFEQARYCKEQGEKFGLSKNAYEAQLRFYSQRACEIFKIWEDVFGGKDRLMRVLATQSANVWTGSTALTWRHAYKASDAVAIAPYFGGRWGNPKKASEVTALTTDELIKALVEDVAISRKQMESYAALARKYGLALVAYEGGQHLVGHGGAENNEQMMKLFHAANRHPGMRDLYLRNLRDWQEAGGDLFCVFSSMGAYSKWGSWGLLEHAAQDLDNAPKYQAIREYLQGTKR